MVTVVYFETPGVRVTTAGVGCVAKSGRAEEMIVPEGVTMSWSVVACEMAPLDAVIVTG